MISTRFCLVAATLVMASLPGLAHANSSTAMSVGAVVLPPACIASTSTANVAVKCAGAYSFVTKVENDATTGQAFGSGQTRGTSQVDVSVRRMTVTY